MRCFNGYIAQGIDDDWAMQVIPLAFEPVKGKHTGVNIKCLYSFFTEINPEDFHDNNFNILWYKYIRSI